jgi:PAS domain S-box-containing protein
MRVAAVRDLSRQKAAEAALRENEARLHAIGEATPALIFSLDRQNRMIYANPATLAVIGRPAEEVLGRTAAEYHSNIAELHDMTRTNRRIMESGQPETVEESFSAVDGGPRVFLSTKAPLRDPSNGAIVGITVVSRDITEQRLVEAGQARLAAIVASTPDAVVSFAADDGLVLSWNRAAEDLFGWTEAEALGRPASLLVPDFRPDGDPTGVYRMTLAGQLVRDHETIRQAKSGELIPVSVAASRMVAPDGRVIGISAIFRDLRPRRAAESALRESEERLRLATEVAQVGILDLDLRTNELRRDERLRALWGMPPGLPDSMDAFYAGLHPDDLARVKAAVAAALDPAGDGSLDSEYRVIDLTNRAERIISAKGQVWFEGGGAVRMVGTVVDVTARRRAEAVLARDKAELERLVEARTQELEQVQEQLAHAQRMEALGRLAGGVAHDFNNVLQAVHGGVSMASRRMRTNPERAQSYLDMVASAAERGAAVTSRLLAFARRSELSAGPVAPAPLLDGLAQLLRPSFGPRIRLRVTVEPEMPAIFADANQLETVMVNLTNNARDALPSDGGTIHLVVAIALPGEAPAHLAPGRYGRLSVTDDGVGMTAEVLARVSEPFFTTKPKGKGTGLGLAMARGFAEQSGGGLTIESERGVGTTVSLWLPLAPAANNGGDMAGPPAREADDAAGSGMAMLLVDDDPAVRVVLAAMLAEQGHAVTEAADATAALALFDTNIAADVLVTDLTMPGDMDGLALVLEARRRRPGLPAVLITGDAGAAGHHALERVSGSGPFAMLNKPVSAKALTAQVADLLRGV